MTTRLPLLLLLLVARGSDAYSFPSFGGRLHRIARVRCPSPEAADDASLSVETVQSMFKEVRAHYRKTGEVEEGQVCRNMMVTRVNDFSGRIERCCVQSSEIHGDGLFATRSIEPGELVTFYPADALLVWEDGNRAGSDMMIFFGAHIPQEDRDAADIANERVRHYELYSSPRISAVGDPSRRDDPSYLGHFANDGATCASPAEVAEYQRASSVAANVEAILLEGCHFALRAVRPIAAGDEVLRSYGEGYWLARNGHVGVGTELERVGSAPSARAQSERLKQALQQSRPRKKKAPSKAKAKKATKPAARGFASS